MTANTGKNENMDNKPINALTVGFLTDFKGLMFIN